MTLTPFVCLPKIAPRAAVAGFLLLLAGFVPGAALSAETPGAEGDGDQAWSERATGDWGGFRGSLLERGVTIDVQVTADSSSSLAGGLRRGTAMRGPVELGLAFDPAPLLGWKGAQLHARLQLHEGQHGTEALVGDAQGFDNIDAQRFRQVSEVWLEQSLLGGKLALKLGKMDANSEFAFVENAGEFLNSSAGFSPTIEGFPSYPDPAGGASVFVRPASWVYSGLGVYDGATHEGCHGRAGRERRDRHRGCRCIA